MSGAEPGNGADQETPLLRAARMYLRRGFKPIPIPGRQKGAVIPGWERLSLTEDELPAHFNGTGNIGLRLGDDAGELVDVDLDCGEAIELADEYLPPTAAVTGRPSKPRSHRWYLAKGVGYKKFKDPVTGESILEVRGRGHQTVVGPSIHPSGEPYDMLEAAPNRAAPAVIWACAEELFKAVVRRRHPTLAGYEPGPGKAVAAPLPAMAARISAIAEDAVVRRAAAYLEAMPAAVSGQNGHGATYAAATALVHGFGIPPDQALTLLLDQFNPRCQPPWNEAELRHKVDDAAGKPHERPFGWLRDAPPISDRAQLSSLPPSNNRAPAAPAVGAASTEPKGHPRTDLGNAERLAKLYRDRLRYCHNMGRWFVWDGARWREDDAGEPHRAAGEVARSILSEAAAAAGAADRKELAEWSFQSESRWRIDNMVALARNHASLVVRVEDLDRDPWLLNVLDGTIDLRSGEIREHRLEDFITKLAPVHYKANTGCPLFKAFLARAMLHDQELIGFVLRLLGMALTGDAREQILAIFHGTGANGKSVLIDLVLAIMGDYAGLAPPSLLTAGRHSEHPTELADLRGKRLIVASETEQNASLKLELLKRLTGDTRLKGRFMRQDYFEFDRTHKTLMVTNHRPRVGDDGEAVWRRIKLVPFNDVIPKAERDTGLLEKLKAERSAILALLVQGCLAWQAEGLGEPPAVRSATAAYRAEEDTLGRFVEERCQVDENPDRRSSKLWTPWKVLRSAYGEWAEEFGEKALSARAMVDAMDKLGFPSVTRRHAARSAKGRAGLSLREAADEEPG